MASKSADHTRSKSARKSDHESVLEPEYQDQPAEDDILPYEDPEPELTAAGENAGPGENAGNVEDEELLEMLEQLSETIDTAHNVLAEQQVLASEAAQPEQAAGLDIPPPPPVAQARRSGFIPALAASFGVFFGIAALAALLLFWNSPEFPRGIGMAKDQDRITETVVSRSPAAGATTPPLAAEPEPAANPLTRNQPAKTAAPLQSQASTAAKPQAPAAVPVTPVEPVIEVQKDSQEMAAIPVDKVPALPPLGKQEETRFLQRGEALVASGDVASARLAYEYAANRGSADAMFALAQTYDLKVLASWNVVGIEPDMSAALEWYGRAAQHGHDPADARASELEKLKALRR